MWVAYMLSNFQWFAFFTILMIALGGGYAPFFRSDKDAGIRGFPNGQAFSAGVFLALALLMMLPSANHLLGKAFARVHFPLAPLLAAMVFFLLLLLQQAQEKMRKNDRERPPGALPVIMTVMIAIPSFFLGAAVGMSDERSGALIVVAIMAHKGSAGFALALKMVQSRLKRSHACIFFLCFAFSTPLGIVLGGDVHRLVSGSTLAVTKGLVLAMASGVFLFMSTLHELKQTPLIRDCTTKKGFAFAVMGFVITALVRVVLGEVHNHH